MPVTAADYLEEAFRGHAFQILEEVVVEAVEAARPARILWRVLAAQIVAVAGEVEALPVDASLEAACRTMVGLMDTPAH